MSNSIWDIDPGLLLILGAILAVVISENLSNGEMNVIGNFLQDIGTGISTYAAQQQLQQENEEMQCRLEEMENQIRLLKEKLR